MKNLIIWAILLGGAAYGGSKFYLHHEVEEGVDAAIMMMSPFATIQYDGISSTMTGELTIDGVRARVTGFRDEIYIDRLGIDTPSFFTLLELGDIANSRNAAASGMPDYFGIIADGIRIPVTADYYKRLYKLRIDTLGATDADQAAAECVGKYGFSPEALSGLGYDEQVMSVAVKVRNGSSDYFLKVNTDIENMWAANISLTLAGDMEAEMAKGIAYRPRLRNMEIEFTDQSLNQRIEKYCGQRGLSAEETLRAQLDAFEFFGESNGIVFDEYVMEPYLQFLGGKSTIIVTAQPGKPINMSQIDLYNPSDVPALLNLSASAR